MCISWSSVILSRNVLFSETTVRGPLNLYVDCDAAVLETLEMRKHIFTISMAKPQ